MANTRGYSYDYTIFKSDSELIKMLLNKYTEGPSRQKAYTRARELYSFFHEFNSLLDVPIDSFRDYIHQINELEMSSDPKRRKIRLIVDILKYAEMMMNLSREKKFELMEKRTQLEFLGQNIRNMGLQRPKIFLSFEEIKEFVEFYEKGSIRDYILICILVYTGARVQAVEKLQIENIDLNNGWFVSRDKLTTNNYMNRYFLPEPFLPFLSYYLEQIQRKTGSLFDLSDKRIREIVKKTGKIKQGKYSDLHPHSFRHNLNTHLLLKGCPEFIAEKLLNQKPKSVNRQHYNLLLQDVEYLKACYHAYFPYKDLFFAYDWTQWTKKLEEYKIK